MKDFSASSRSHIAETNSPEALRRAIDLVATLRARVIRVGLFGNLLYRKDPSGDTTQEERARFLNILETEVAWISTVCACLKNGAPLPDTAPAITTWIAQISATLPHTIATILELDRLSKEVLQQAHTQSSGQKSALALHMKTARSGFFDAVTQLSDHLWDDLRTFHDTALAQANTAAQTLGDRLNRLEHIGKHVRLVSLNASVEAARAGEVGKGLMVIAQEFKSLAEEIQKLAKDAHADIAAIS